MDFLTKTLIKTSSTALLMAILIASGSVIGFAAYQTTQKQKVVAAVIFKFIKFVEWEYQSEIDRTSFNMCLQQHDAAFEPFEQRKVQGREIKLLLLEANKQRLQCDALFLNATGNQSMALLNYYKNQPTLTISEQPDFLAQGGVVELGKQNNRLIFSINNRVAQANKMSIGFQLLSLAKNVLEN